MSSDTTGAQVYDSGFLGSPDGTGVIQGANIFSGDLISNDKDGNVFLLDPFVHTSLLIATGGSRVDYVGIDSTHGTLFLTQTDSVYRLACGQASCFFSAPVPEPKTYALMLAGLAGLAGLACIGAMRRRRS